jgi:2,6-dihydroxypseudooxynicotine hydrolase
MIPGANSVKEELYHWGWEFNQRGISTLAFDGPGQGELSVYNGGIPLRLETYHHAVSAVIDYLETREDVDSSRVVAWGQSTGGQLAIRAAGMEARIFGAVSLGGGYDYRLEITSTTPADVWEEARELYGFETFAQVKDYVLQRGSLEGVAEKVTCPLLLIHGELDNIVALEEMERIKQESRGKTDLLVYKNGNHSVCNYNLEMRSAMADWVLELVRNDC